MHMFIFKKNIASPVEFKNAMKSLYAPHKPGTVACMQRP